MDYKQRQDRLSVTLTALQSQRQALEERVDYLKADGLHLDMLDMESRRVLFITKPHEYTIWLDPEL